MSTARRIAGAAALIALITIAARIVGFGRNLVFYWAIGENDLAQIYQTANTVPNLIFEITAGGALASLVVPLLAAPRARDDRAAVSAATSALLTWTMVVLVPAALLVAIFADPIVNLMAADAPPAMVETGARMLRIFAPQLPLYGLGTVLIGVLQAHERFAWPALAPLLSSVTVICAYTLFTIVDSRGAGIGEVTRTGELVLSVGTTCGVVALSCSLLIPLSRLGIRYRPTLRFPDGMAAGVRSLAIAGAVTIGAQQVALGLVIYLTNPPAPDGSIVVYTLAQTLFFLPWGVLAVPLATAAYPTLAEAVAVGDHARYARTLAASTRGSLLVGWFGAATLVAVAAPAAGVIGSFAPGQASYTALAYSIVFFAPGLVGYSLFALLTRALYARGDTALAARATVAGWGTVMLADLVLVSVVPLSDRVVALAVGNTIGMIVLGALLIAVVARRAGRHALDGAGRSCLVGLVAAVLSGAVGWALAAVLTGEPDAHPGPIVSLAAGVLVGLVVLGVFGGVTLLVARREVAPLVSRFAARIPGLRHAATGGEQPPAVTPADEAPDRNTTDVTGRSDEGEHSAPRSRGRV